MKWFNFNKKKNIELLRYFSKCLKSLHDFFTLLNIVRIPNIELLEWIAIRQFEGLNETWTRFPRGHHRSRGDCSVNSSQFRELICPKGWQGTFKSVSRLLSYYHRLFDRVARVSILIRFACANSNQMEGNYSRLIHRTVY